MVIQLALARKNRHFVRRRRRRFLLVKYTRVGWTIAPLPREDYWLDYDSDPDPVDSFDDPYSVAVGMIEYGMDNHTTIACEQLESLLGQYRIGKLFNQISSGETVSQSFLDTSTVQPTWEEETGSREPDPYAKPNSTVEFPVHKLEVQTPNIAYLISTNAHEQAVEPPINLSIETQCGANIPDGQRSLLTPPITPGSSKTQSGSSDSSPVLKKTLSTPPSSLSLRQLENVSLTPEPLPSDLSGESARSKSGKQNVYFWSNDPKEPVNGSRHWATNSRFNFPDKSSSLSSSTSGTHSAVSDGTLHSIFGNERQGSMDTVDSWLALEMTALESRNASAGLNSYGHEVPHPKYLDGKSSPCPDRISRESSVSLLSPLFNAPLAAITEAPNLEPIGPKSTVTPVKPHKPFASSDRGPEFHAPDDYGTCAPTDPKWIGSSFPENGATLTTYSFQPESSNVAIVDLDSCGKPSPVLDDYTFSQFSGFSTPPRSSACPSPLSARTSKPSIHAVAGEAIPRAIIHCQSDSVRENALKIIPSQGRAIPHKPEVRKITSPFLEANSTIKQKIPKKHPMSMKFSAWKLKKRVAKK
ncbi:hypothetical protein NEOLI_000892 [Neolecta irregularis DAH-3]|uniref:Uncharacterized protein n=1 Tax=Neolecta irregularis (strain DAH-3) TaxID=1198029 RepID=A0A1U7LUI4_NEOID|nr:hypothetical protein NEOLI_000892 [Neolecta irregularis DAH-3]|eukprot:OLL26336.1 hypothetical protein NEOLI_000892 [Neolecta irregularis DAH-3]